MTFVSISTLCTAMLFACAFSPVAGEESQLTRKGIIGVNLLDESQSTSMRSSHVEDVIVGNVGLIDPVLRLNRVTLPASVLVEDSSEISQWIVSFCAPWHPDCQASASIFSMAADHWQEKLNTGLFTKEVKFADVDCAVDKVLCNSQNVQTYPFAAHYRNGKQVSTWKVTGRNDEERFRNWLQKELDSGSQASVTEEEATETSWQRLWQRVVTKAISGWQRVRMQTSLLWSSLSPRSSRPTMGDKVIVLDTNNTQHFFPSGINKQFVITDDVKDDEPFQVNGHRVWLREADVQLLTPPRVEDVQGATAWSKKHIMSFVMHALLIVAALAGIRSIYSSVLGPCDGSPSQTALQDGGGTAQLSSTKAKQQTSSAVARCLPKEWGQDRPSLQL